MINGNLTVEYQRNWPQGEERCNQKNFENFKIDILLIQEGKKGGILSNVYS